jgi:hypothetical protein
MVCGRRKKRLRVSLNDSNALYEKETLACGHVKNRVVFFCPLRNKKAGKKISTLPLCGGFLT